MLQASQEVISFKKRIFAKPSIQIVLFYNKTLKITTIRQVIVFTPTLYFMVYSKPLAYNRVW